MSKYVGNTSHLVDWDNLINKLSTMEPAYVGPRHKKGDPIKGLDLVIAQWERAKHIKISDGGTCGWDMFFEHSHYPIDITHTISNYLNISPINAWISRVNPGYMSPWHWDANDNEELYNTYDDLVRFSCHISKPAVGHAFTVDNSCITNYNQGDVFQWESRKSWHAGVNFGYTPKYVLNIFGHKQ